MPFVLTPDAGKKITVQLDPDDPDSAVELTLVEKLSLRENSGVTFQRYNYEFNNGDDTSRTVAIREITHKKRLPGKEWNGGGKPLKDSEAEDDDDDDGQKIKTEVIVKLTTEHGSGHEFERSIYGLDPLDPLRWRKGHIKRIFGKNPDGSKNEDLWLDIFRKDQFVSFDGEGPAYQAQLITVAWPDAEDDNLFDSNDLIAEPAPSDPTTPVRTDFLQDIVNINVGTPILVLILEATSYQTGANFGVNWPEIPAIERPPLPAIPAIPAGGAGFASEEQSISGTFSPIENPLTADMRKNMRAWTLQDRYTDMELGYFTTNPWGPPALAPNNNFTLITVTETYSSTLFINLARFVRTPGPFFLELIIPALPDQAVYNVLGPWWWSVTIEGHDAGNVPFSETDYVTGFDSVNANDQGAFMVANALLQGALDAHVTDITKMMPEFPPDPPETQTWTLRAETYGAGAKNFTLDDHSLPTWPKVDKMKPVSTAEIGDSATSPEPQKKYKITLDGLKVSIALET